MDKTNLNVEWTFWWIHLHFSSKFPYTHCNNPLPKQQSTTTLRCVVKLPAHSKNHPPNWLTVANAPLPWNPRHREKSEKISFSRWLHLRSAKVDANFVGEENPHFNRVNLKNVFPAWKSFSPRAVKGRKARRGGKSWPVLHPGGRKATALEGHFNLISSL